MQFRRRRGPPVRLIAGAGAILVLALVGAVFWFAGEADKRAPEPRTIEVEATNVGGG
jgi:hypothetical protein